MNKFMPDYGKLKLKKIFKQLRSNNWYHIRVLIVIHVHIGEQFLDNIWHLHSLSTDRCFKVR